MMIGCQSTTCALTFILVSVTLHSTAIAEAPPSEAPTDFVDLFRVGAEDAGETKATDAIKSPSNNPFRSPMGALEIDIHPMMQFEVAGGIAACVNITYQPSDVLEGSLAWPWSGLHKLAQFVYQKYTQGEEEHIKSLRFKDKRSLVDSAFAKGEGIADCVARRMIVNQLSLSASSCSCLSSRDDNGACEYMDFWATTVHCHDQMAQHFNKEQCSTFLLEDRGVPMSQMCTGNISAGLHGADMDLYSLNYPGMVPNSIDGKTAKEESRAYYVGFKALDRMSRWADSHLFCSDRVASSRANLLDLKILPKYKPGLYFYMRYRDGRRVPIAAAYSKKETILLVVRDVKTTIEGRLMMTTQLAEALSWNSVGQVHEGYQSLAIQLIPPLMRFTELHFASLINPVAPRILVLGSGMFGSGIGAIVARHMGTAFHDIYRPYKTTTPEPTSTLDANGQPSFADSEEATTQPPVAVAHITTHLLAFEGGAVGDHEFTTDLRTKVNVRNVVPDTSGFKDIPCEISPGCHGNTYQVHSGKTGAKNGPFQPLPGRVTLTTEELSNDVWRTKSVKLELLANKVCAIPCWLSTKHCTDDPAKLCSLEQCGLFFTPEALEVKRS